MLGSQPQSRYNFTMKNGTARMPRKRAKRQQPSLTINLRVTAAQGAALSGPGLTVGQSIRALIERATGLPGPKRGRPRRETT